MKYSAKRQVITSDKRVPAWIISDNATSRDELRLYADREEKGLRKEAVSV